MMLIGKKAKIAKRIMTEMWKEIYQSTKDVTREERELRGWILSLRELNGLFNLAVRNPTKKNILSTIEKAENLQQEFEDVGRTEKDIKRMLRAINHNISRELKILTAIAVELKYKS